MAYNLTILSELVRSELTTEPRLTLSTLAHQLGVDRHTVQKAIRLTRGTSFRELQSDLLLARTHALLRSSPALSVKEISHCLGYGSSRAFQRFVLRSSGKTPMELRYALSSISCSRGSASDTPNNALKG